MFFASLNSGSNANCYFAGSLQNAVLIDAGLSCRETMNRLQALQIKPNTIKAVFISHEHTDHIKGVEVIAKKLQVPVFISKATLQNSRLFIPEQQLRFLKHGEKYVFDDIVVEAFSKHHDAADPFSFVVSTASTNLGVITDVGHACDNVIQAVANCHALLLETNYDETMLMEGHYPFHLKQRIKSDKGHLSNIQALELLQQYKHEDLCLIALGHLSKENNHPALVEQLFKQHFTNLHVHVASRYQSSPLFSVTRAGNQYQVVERTVQTELFSG